MKITKVNNIWGLSCPPLKKDYIQFKKLNYNKGKSKVIK